MYVFFTHPIDAAAALPPYPSVSIGGCAQRALQDSPSLLDRLVVPDPVHHQSLIPLVPDFIISAARRLSDEPYPDHSKYHARVEKSTQVADFKIGVLCGQIALRGRV